MFIFKKLLILIPFALAIGTMQAEAFSATVPYVMHENQQSLGQLLASHSMSLDDRYPIKSVSDVFKNNILLALAYMSGTVRNASQVKWDTIHKSTTFELTLQPSEVFAFHDTVLPEYADKHATTTNAHFDASEGFLYDGDLYGDGVCHFASLINWVATDAGLKVVAPIRHDFAKIPDIDSKYGTAIYAGDSEQNLYVENTFDKPVKLVFTYANDTMTVSVYK